MAMTGRRRVALESTNGKKAALICNESRQGFEEKNCFIADVHIKKLKPGIGFIRARRLRPW